MNIFQLFIKKHTLKISLWCLFCSLVALAVVCCSSDNTYYQEWRDPVTGMEFVWIPAGSFTMGSPDTEASRDSDEGPQHIVSLTHGFWMGKYEVTQAQWEQIMGWNPVVIQPQGDNYPVVMVSWNDCQDFIARLNAQSTKAEFSLPTEAQWEYACRAGTTTPFYTGDCLPTNQANYDGSFPYNGCPAGEYRRHIIPVGSLASNNWWLYDMHGNVWEWCQDRYGSYSSDYAVNPAGPSSGTMRVWRGGSWGDKALFCRSADRSRYDPDEARDYIGFRLVRVK